MDSSFTFLANLLLLMLFLGTGVVAAIKMRASPAASIVAALGFGLLALVEVLLLAINRGMFYPSPNFFMMTQALRIAGFGAILAALLVMPTGQGGATATVLAPVKVGALPPSRHRPGWGLVATWIVFSSLSFLLGLVSLGLVIDAGNYISSREWELLLPVMILSFLMVIPAVIFQVLWLYFAWDAVPPQFRSASPGAAVGLLFVPFFNVYWVFRAVVGLSASIRRTLQALEGPNAGGAGQGLAIAACVVSFVPFVNLSAWILFLIWVCLANSAKNRMLRLLAGTA